MNTIVCFGLDRLLQEILATALSNHQWRLVSLEEAVGESAIEIALAPGSGAADDVVADICYLRQRFPSSKVILLGIEGTDADIIRFIQEGARGFVTIQQGLADLVETLNMARESRGSCSGSVTQLVIDGIYQLSQRNPRRETRLTARENQILKMIQDGLSNKEIAGQLCIAPNTVKNHVHHLLAKLSLRSRHEVARVQTPRPRLLLRTPGASTGPRVHRVQIPDLA